MSKKIKKVLFVEDDPSIIDVYSIMMKKEHFDVEAISSGQEALRKIKNIVAGDNGKPDMILLDLILPDIDGMEILKEVKKNKETKDIKVLVLTNKQDTQLQLPDDFKPDNFLIKANTSPTQLLELIKKQLK